MALTIDNLEIQVETKATKAKSGLDSLADSLTKLKIAVGDTSGLAMNLKGIANALNTFSAVGKIRMTIPVNQLKKLESVVPTLGSAQATQMADNLSKIADSIATFSATANVGKQMKDAAKGMDALAKSSQRYEEAIKKSDVAHKSTLRYMSEFVNQYRRLYHAIDEVVDICADLFDESNEYVEALNLFKVSMGDASEAALEYAETVSAAMGIDPAEWITNQGTFQRMATGFGIASEEAEIMSRNLTQLAYDMSSFFNTDVQTATEKLQSGMSGQIKGLKAWGYNLSVAALQETALNLGIEESVRNMTEAQKAQLRYITLIQRSNGIMGDMAKTIITPSNALRVLDAQVTKMKRSLGNLVSVIATRVIPYAQALVEVMAEVAETLAEAWGFEIEDLPTNNLEMASDVIEGIGDDVDNTSDSVAELKKQLAGFDELNILTNKDDNDKTGGQNSLNIDLPEYDFLSNLDDETRKRIDEIKGEIKDLLPLLETLAKAFAAAFAVKAFYDAGTAIEKFFTTTSLGQDIALTAMYAFSDFKDTLKATKNPLKALGTSAKGVWNNFKGMMSSLSPLAKTLVSVVAIGVEFKVVKDNVKGLADGTKSWGEALLAIIPTCAAVGVAMYAMLGPWGLVAAAVTGVTAAIVGFVQGEKEMRSQLANTSFYDGYGTKISKLSDAFDELLISATSSFDTIIEKQADILVAKDNIKDTKTEFALLISEVTNGATTIEEAMPRMTDAFENLYNDSRTYLLGVAGLLYAALTGSSLDGIETYMQTISNVTGATIKEMEESQKRIEEAKKQFESGAITEDAYLQIYIEENAKVSSWTSVEGDLKKTVSGALSGLSEIFAEGINWESANLEGDLQEIMNSANNAKKTITDAYGGIYDALSEVRKQAETQGNTDAIIQVDKMLAEFKALEQADIGKVDNMLDTVVGKLRASLVEKVKGLYAQSKEEFDGLNLFQQIWYGDSVGYAEAVLKDFKEDVLPGISEALANVFGEDASVDSDFLVNFGSTIRGLDDVFAETMEEAGTFTAEGLILGLTSEQAEVYSKARELGLSVLEAYDKALDINSPSVEMEKRGEYSIQGLVIGLSDTTALSLAIDNIVKQFDILSPIKSLWSKVTEWWKGISLPENNLGAKISDIFNVGQYASDSSSFLAKGTEIVNRISNKNAGANNGQITAGIASAVYNAMMAAKEDGNEGGTPARIVVQIDGTPVGEAAVRFINGQIVQTGVSPIYN